MRFDWFADFNASGFAGGIDRESGKFRAPRTWHSKSYDAISTPSRGWIFLDTLFSFH
jgi:hypothetical protein